MRLGYKLNEYGIFKREDDKQLAGEIEVSIYKTLGLEFIEPELRQDQGEIEAAERGALPKLVGYVDVRGDLHVHSKRGDVTATLEEISKEA